MSCQQVIPSGQSAGLYTQRRAHSPLWSTAVSHVTYMQVSCGQSAAFLHWLYNGKTQFASPNPASAALSSAKSMTLSNVQTSDTDTAGSLPQPTNKTATRVASIANTTIPTHGNTNTVDIFIAFPFCRDRKLPRLSV